jgi:hypothetical protein
MLTLGPRHTILSIALFIGMGFNFCTPTMVVQAATYSKSPAVVPPTPVDENVAAEDDPDANLVPLDTEGPTTDAIGDLTTPTSSVPRAEDLLELNPAENAPATARFSDAFNPPAELAQTPNSSKSGTNQAESAIYNSDCDGSVGPGPYSLLQYIHPWSL